MNPEQKMQEILDKATTTIDDIHNKSEASIRRLEEASAKIMNRMWAIVLVAFIPLVGALVQLEVGQAQSMTRDQAYETFTTKQDVNKAFNLQAENNKRIWALTTADSVKIAEYNTNYLWLIQALFDVKTRGK